MIKLRNLEKYYNRKKSNEIHVINDITLDLPNEGLVVLLGPSGSGKTTLLNVLGGLDKVQSGIIEYGDIKMTHYSSKVWDQIRNKEVGYIFQNYNLLDNLTVYDNISLTLNMIGIYDKEEIDRRIDYILDSMGMINYRKRRASQLSGGQQQRVAIARALAKNPQVIIADEPTGNLDSKNTQEIMNIIKAISRNKLVVLVTHEEAIANFYGDRIIRLKDGEIVSDVDNTSNGTLDVRHETDIYLGDMRQVVDTAQNNSTLKVYSDEELDDNVNIRLIVKNKTLYVDISSEQYKKIQLLESDSEIKLIDKKYEEPTRDSLDGHEFNLDDIITKEHTSHEKHSVISIKDSLRFAWKRILNTKTIGKVFYFGFAALSALIAIAVGLANSFVTIDKDQYLNDSKYLITAQQGNNTYNQLLALQDDPSISYIRLQRTASINIQVVLPTIFQAYGSTTNLSGTPERAENLNTAKLISGRAIESDDEFVIDKRMADNMIGSSDYQYLGISSYQDLYELEFNIQLPSTTTDTTYPMKLVGIVDDDSPLIYLNSDIMLMKLYNIGIYEYYQDDITLASGSALGDSPEVLIYNNPVTSGIDLSEIYFNMFNVKFQAVGRYDTDIQMPDVLVKRDVINEAYYNDYYPSQRSEVHFITTDVKDAMKFLSAQGFVPEGYAATARQTYLTNRINGGIAIIIFFSVAFAASALAYFFVIRSSLLSRIYEVSVYRALGVTKFDISKMFMVEAALVTTITSLIGYAAMTVFLYRLQLMIEDFTAAIKISPLSVIGGIIILYLVNIISGLIPVTNLMRKTPAEILSKYDF